MTISKNEQQWLAKLDDLVAFRAEHGTWPRRLSAGAPESEGTLGNWLRTQRTANKNGDLTADRRQLLETRAPGWNDGQEQQWLAKLDDLVAFRAEHGSWPRTKGADRSEHEKTLGTWLSNQRTRPHRLTTERHKLLDTRAPGWDQGQDLEQQWLATLDDLVAFRAEHGTWPRNPWSGVPEDEGSLGSWLRTQRTANKNGDLTADRRQLLETRAPGWTETRLSERVWLARLNDLVAFRAEHGTWPRTSGADRSEHEKTLGTWLSNQRTRPHRLTTERRQLLETRAPGWNDGQEQQWLATLDDLVSFRTEHGTWPRTGGTNLSQREKTLGMWLDTQRARNKHGNLTAERRNLLDERVPGWSLGNRKAPERRLTQDEKVHMVVTYAPVVLKDW